jgi:hypothetical protein
MRQEIVLHTAFCNSFRAKAFLTIMNKCNREGERDNLPNGFKSKFISKVIMKEGVNKYSLKPFLT